VTSGIFEWIDADDRFRLALMPRPPGGQRLDLAMRALRREGVDLIVSLQPEDEAALCGLEREAEAAELAGMDFLRFAIPDHGVPEDPDAMVAFADEVLRRLDAGQATLAHCYAGIGRSGILAVGVMMRAGFSYDEAAYRAMAARKLRVPETEAQSRWVRRVFGEE
jgi:protein-tyrosine phosphatase